MKVLIVDDDRSVRESIGKVLGNVGYEVVLAADGKEALQRFDPEQIDLLLLDLGLPMKSGWDTFEHITNENPALPIIVITGQTKQYDVAVAAGVSAFMEKPVDVSQLLQTMRELLAEPKEARLHRLCGHRRDVRHIPPSSASFLKQLRQRHETAFRYRRPKADGSME
jgi:CheY-like chemotaxis protein